MSTSYPSQLNKFRKWAKAMEEGAIVGKPDYGKTLRGSRHRRPARKQRKRRLRRKRRSMKD